MGRKNYKLGFTVYYSKETGRILSEVWKIKKRIFPFIWKTVKSPDFKDYKEAISWAKENLNVKPEYCYHGKEKAV